jgi:DNA-binding response OmpR family regulator
MVDGSAEEKARLLLLYTDAAQAAALVQSLPGEGYDVVSCPVSAIDRWLEELQPALILLDPPSEHRQFLEACESLRAQTERPIVVLSARSEELLVSRVLAAGIDDYLVLPIGVRELAARIEAMLRRYAWSKETHQVGDLILSSDDLSVERNGHRVLLTQIEFRLLACLASAPGKVLTHQTLMSRVWGPEYVYSRHYLHLYIRYLREKLEDDPARPQMILNAWGVGYRIQPP